jgi:hypothetical protein
MPIRVTCPKCQSIFACPDDYRGRALRCKKCGQPFVVGSPARSKTAAARPAPPVRQKPSRGRFLLAALVALLIGAAAGFPAAYFLLKKETPANPIAAGPTPTTPDEHTRGPERPPSSLPAATGKQEPPRETSTSPRPVSAPVVWEDFTSRDWGFSVRFPGSPRVSSVPGSGAKGPQIFSASIPASPERKAVTFTVTCEDHDPRLTTDAEGFLAGRIADLDPQAKTKTALKLAGFPGVEARSETTDAGAWLTTQRIYLIRARTYHLVASGPSVKEVPSFFKEFFDSFTLLNPGQPEPPAAPSLRDRVAAWLAGNAASPEKVAEQEKELLAPLKDGFGFTLALGDGVLKSKKPSLLVGWAGELLLFELSAEQTKALKLGDRDLRLNSFSEPPGRRAEKPPFALSDLKMTSLMPKVVGTVVYRAGMAPAGPLVLRLAYPVGSALRVRRQTIEAKGDSGTLMLNAQPLTTDDPQLSGPVVILVEVCSAEAAGKPEVVLSNAAAVLVTIAAGPPKDGVAGLQLSVPSGWKADYNKFLGGVGGWVVTKPPPTARSEEEVVRIEECPAEARTAADYAAHLKDKEFLNVDLPGWVEVGDKEELPEGFVFKGVVKKFPNPKTPPILGVVAVREINGLKVRCFSANLRSEESREETLKMFKAAKFGPR